MIKKTLETKRVEYIDIHSHILPCVDDGASSVEISMRMLRIAYEEGIRTIILTPHNKPSHSNRSEETMQRLFLQFQEAVSKENINITLYFGNEIYYRSDVFELLKNDKISTMAGSSYVLVEFSPMDDYEYIRNGIYRFLAEGYLPILAHAERYEKLQGKINHIEDLVNMGCYIQMNADSLLGKMGYQAKRFSKSMLKKKLIHFVATDAHNDKKRAPSIERCAKYIEKKYGKDYKKKLLYGNPNCVIKGNCI